MLLTTALILSFSLTYQCMNQYQDGCYDVDRHYWQNDEPNRHFQGFGDMDSDQIMLLTDDFYDELPDILENIDLENASSYEPDMSESYSGSNGVPTYERDETDAMLHAHYGRCNTGGNTHHSPGDVAIKARKYGSSSIPDRRSRPAAKAAQDVARIKKIRVNKGGGRHRAVAYELQEGCTAEKPGHEWWRPYDSEQINYALDRLTDTWEYNRSKQNRASLRKRFKYHLNPEDMDVILYGTPIEAEMVAKKYPMMSALGPTWFAALDEGIRDQLMEQFCFYFNYTSRNVKNYFNKLGSVEEAQECIADIEATLIAKNRTEQLWQNQTASHQASASSKQKQDRLYSWQIQLSIPERKILYNKFISKMSLVPFQIVKEKVDDSKFMTRDLARLIIADNQDAFAHIVEEIHHAHEAPV